LGLGGLGGSDFVGDAIPMGVQRVDLGGSLIELLRVMMIHLLLGVFEESMELGPGQ